MPPMLPAAPDGAVRLADVLPSCLASLEAEPNILGLPPARAAIVVLVDGLGASNIKSRAGHARFLASRLGRRDIAIGHFPSTTAAGIASLTTGTPPGQHGLVGYATLDTEADRIVNQLNGWDHGLLGPEWQRSETVFERAAARGLPSFAVGLPRYATSGLTGAILRGAEYVIAGTLTERFAEAERLASTGGRAIIYVYVAELDVIAHASGWESSRWTSTLETLDSELASLDARLPRDVGLIVTADHGIVDVPAHKHVFLDRDQGLLVGVRHVGGEPRCRYLYLEPELDDAGRAALLDAWRAAEGHRAWVFSRDEAIDAGLFGDVDPAVAPRIGDIVIAARSGIAYYDGRDPNVQSHGMVGQHGSLSDEETRLPLIRGGAYRRD
ncbi:alkaline phosphatase family protein [Agromyces atrinae]|nr:nucleotide pyrophosphatase/phosphodiesterase family protein [Agromyces atrinae]NYD66097.1 putative AlkP superfamily pyrophosphatase or phosphodiesterase [Agromyces atrinae]